ncbi:MAG: hypothetical protein HQK75_17180 [Candidatus Magnetomorum sp.]|nr:hypothetical protein [Candidatus Magnetomorum sp.]
MKACGFLKKNGRYRIYLIHFLLIIGFPSLIYAQAESLATLQESFQHNIQYLATTYLENMINMTTTTNSDLTRMEHALELKVHEMVITNQKELSRTAFQLNHEMPLALTREMKQLQKEVIDMQHRLTSQFNQ